MSLFIVIQLSTKTQATSSYISILYGGEVGIFIPVPCFASKLSVNTSVFVVSNEDTGIVPAFGRISTYSSRTLRTICAPILSYIVPSGSGTVSFGTNEMSAKGHIELTTNDAPSFV